MTPEAAGHLDKAGDYLTKARGLPNVLHYTDEAGRAAYFAGYHAAQALIFERTGREAKTHKRRAHPVQQNGRGDPRFDTEREPLDGNTKPRDADDSHSRRGENPDVLRRSQPAALSCYNRRQ